MCAQPTNACCAAVRDSACIYAINHTVVGYSTADFKAWAFLGVLLPVEGRAAGTLFRPHVVHNPHTNLYTMWFENFNASADPAACGPHTSGCHYSVATAAHPAGPWHTVRDGTDGAKFKCSTAEGDFDLFVDHDGTGYIVVTHYSELCIERLTEAFTDGTGETATIAGQKITGVAGESPVMFSRGGLYYVMWGSGCCACSVGASVFVHVARSPLGPYRYLGDIGTDPGHKACNPCDGKFVTKAQQSAVLDVAGEIVWVGNQWQSAADGQLNHGLLYFTPLSFHANGSITHLTWRDNITIPTRSF